LREKFDALGYAPDPLMQKEISLQESFVGFGIDLTGWNGRDPLLISKLNLNLARDRSRQFPLQHQDVG
jgi:hypothetical protein